MPSDKPKKQTAPKKRMAKAHKDALKKNDGGKSFLKKFTLSDDPRFPKVG